jgi:hypothetical protein
LEQGTGLGAKVSPHASKRWLGLFVIPAPAGHHSFTDLVKGYAPSEVFWAAKVIHIGCGEELRQLSSPMLNNFWISYKGWGEEAQFS